MSKTVSFFYHCVKFNFSFYIVLFSSYCIIGYRPCCGSVVTQGTEKLAEFSKVYSTTFNAVSGRPEDGYKPSRISDLRVDNVDENKITLKWTAPGEEADTGTGEIIFFKLDAAIFFLRFL